MARKKKARLNKKRTPKKRIEGSDRKEPRNEVRMSPTDKEFSTTESEETRGQATSAIFWSWKSRTRRGTKLRQLDTERFFGNNYW